EHPERQRRAFPLHRVRAGPGTDGDVRRARSAGHPRGPRQHHPGPGKGDGRSDRGREVRSRRVRRRGLWRAPRRPDPARAEEALRRPAPAAGHAGRAQHELRPARGDDPEGRHERGGRRPEPPDGRQGPAFRDRGHRSARGVGRRARARPRARRGRPPAL
ncbi:MAG: FKBP-type peptidyl-prolyl cis-trans isomerase SlyD, partial [uncultured Lysobacter sp.]